jgi:hypothetical protein
MEDILKQLQAVMAEYGLQVIGCKNVGKICWQADEKA